MREVSKDKPLWTIAGPPAHCGIRQGHRCCCLREQRLRFVGCLLACLMSLQHANRSQGRICSDNFTCCHTQTKHQTLYLTQSQYTDTGLTSLSADPITPGAWQGGHWSANVEVTGMTGKNSHGASGSRTPEGARIAQLVVLGLAVHSVAGSILLWGHFR